MFSNLTFTIIFKLILALALGGFLGLEREQVGKPAGVRTFALVSIGSALYVILSQFLMQDAILNANTNFDPSRVISQIIVGIGFLGGGVILRHGYQVIGLTTAAELWVVAAIGAAVALGYYSLASIVALLAFLIMFAAGRWTKKIEPHPRPDDDDKN